MSPKPATVPIRISSTGADPVVFTPDDYDVFVLSQREAVDAAKQHQRAELAEQEVGEKLASRIYRIGRWCKANNVSTCVVAPRMDDLLVVVIAKDEDEGGRLHDAMSAFDLEAFQQDNLRLSWLLLRASESDGLSSFVDPASARIVYRGDR